MNFYTSVAVYGNKILYRGIENGRRVSKREGYAPSFFVPGTDPGNFKTIHGEQVKQVNFSDIKSAKAFLEKYEKVDNFKIYGNERYEYAFLADKFPGDVEWDKSKILIANIDIEVAKDEEHGYSSAHDATNPVTSITYKRYNEILVFGLGDFKTDREDVKYFKFATEELMLRGFLRIWSSDYPDVITGWNVKFYDIPYLINRLTRLFGEEVAKTFSPWRRFGERFIKYMGRDEKYLTVSGIAIYDMLELYRKFAKKGTSQESYALNNIAHVELGERKLDYTEYGSLNNLYKENHQLFIEYNIKDVELVAQMEERGKNCAGILSLALTLAYRAKVNYEDALQQTRMWDSIIFGVMKKKKMVVPLIRKHTKTAYEGAYVKEPIPGMYRWVVSFDLNSLYPHLIMQYNISPDTIVEPEHYTDGHRGLLAQGITVDKLVAESIDLTPLRALNCTMTPNGQFFTLARYGLLPQIMQEMYDARVVYKNKMIDAKKALVTDPDNAELKRLASTFSNLQEAIKVTLNSAYGGLANEYFRMFDVRQAEGITSGGRLSIKWVEKAINAALNKTLKTQGVDYVVAIDTDSVYVCFAQLVDKVFASKNSDTETVVNFLDKVSQTLFTEIIDGAYGNLASYVNAYAQKMQMKRESICETAIWTAKKRYILKVWDQEGVRYTEPDIKISGLEIVKSSTPQTCRDKLKQAVKVILDGSQQDILAFIETYREAFERLAIEEIAFPRGITSLNKYLDGNHGRPIHVHGAITFNEQLRKHGLERTYESIGEGEKIKFVALSQPNPFHSHVISFKTVLPKEFELEKFIDYDSQFEKAFLAPLKIILDSIGWRHEREKPSIASFFR
jgi:DNA polymerase elongation subunit (family B)